MSTLSVAEEKELDEISDLIANANVNELSYSAHMKRLNEELNEIDGDQLNDPIVSAKVWKLFKELKMYLKK